MSEPSPDRVLLDQLAKTGSDPEKLHRIEFTLHLPSQKAAQRAEMQLLGFAFETRIEAGKTPTDWVLRGTKKMYPREPDLAGLRDKLEAIAAEQKGRYEGWRAKPLP